MSATLRASSPGVSNVKDSGTTPAVDQRPIVIFSPALPVIEAGMRTEPAVSLPNASKADPSRRLTPAPLDEPPTERCAAASQGVVRCPLVAVLPGAAKRELDHVGLAHDHTELAAQRRDKRPVLLPAIRRQAPARSGKAGIPVSGEQ